MAEQTSDQRLAGKVAFITGAASGIGLACAQRLAREGAAIVGFDLEVPGAWSSITEISDNNLLLQGDVTQLDQQQAAVEEAVQKFGAIDIVVTSAGIGDAGPVHMVEQEAWQRVIDINLTGTFLSIKAALPHLMKQRSGSIITIASVEGQIASEGGSSYNASKAAVINLTKNVAMDYGQMGIRANAICPGFIETPMFHSVMDQMPDLKESVRKEHKMARFGQPEEMAGIAYFLASDDSSFVTGQAIAGDGGYTCGPSHGIVELMGLK
ncbi:MAG: SDR family NAD(P)-dependent oxidoreductase [Pseudomonadales bacterium]